MFKFCSWFQLPALEAVVGTQHRIWSTKCTEHAERLNFDLPFTREVYLTVDTVLCKVLEGRVESMEYCPRELLPTSTSFPLVIAFGRHMSHCAKGQDRFRVPSNSHAVVHWPTSAPTARWGHHRSSNERGALAFHTVARFLSGVFSHVETLLTNREYQDNEDPDESDAPAQAAEWHRGWKEVEALLPHLVAIRVEERARVQQGAAVPLTTSSVHSVRARFILLNGGPDAGSST
ncbi:hypothetical protein FB451DRAFT_1193871 [Mycena latifolia]|nr:hypothetical protein FB451DRAFT_1193871 [Mycena latifolia]